MSYFLYRRSAVTLPANNGYTTTERRHKKYTVFSGKPIYTLHTNKIAST